MRVTWNAPEGRFFDTGLDRGMLYPKGTPPLGPIVATNLATNARGLSTDPEGDRIWAVYNRALNPRGAVNINHWLAGNGTVLRIVDPDGRTWLKAPEGATGWLYGTASGLTLGKFYAYTMKLRGTPGTVIDAASTDNVVGGIHGSKTVTMPASGEMTLEVPAGAAAQGTTVNFGIYSIPSVAVTDVILTEVSATGKTVDYLFFDGETPNRNGLDFFWTGTAHNSVAVGSGLLMPGWYEMGGGTATQAGPDGGINVRTGPAGTGAYHSPGVSYGAVGKYYSARYRIRRIPGEKTFGDMGTPLYDGAGYIAQPATAISHGNLPADGSPITVDVIATAPSTTTNTPALFLYAYPGANFQIMDVIIQEVSGPGKKVDSDPFDGNSESGAYTFAWTGTPNSSSSTKREILTYAVPWGGLVSVDEEGGDGASSYYIDGRPFLFLPKPKEYKATLKAYTYPDEFSDIMGVTEVADGMYLDSQPGKAFDLCYRTMVGNAHEGVDHGYKLHLVYNATVTPQALTYESLSNSINPTTFSWEIQAVPVRVEGFRPTAHIIIDTRHMDPKKIAAIEALVYGSEDEIPHMPSPQIIFDLLSFGDTITVIDNGDGTFDVVGSYENVYMVGPGVFRVDNVDGQDNGDGTFTISTTTA